MSRGGDADARADAAAAPTATQAEATYADVLDALAPRGVTSRSMFGSPALRAPSGKAFAAWHPDFLVCRLVAGTPEHAEALGLPGAVLFDPSGAGRAMKDWVVVPVAHAEHWERFATAALERL